jgi:alpha-L-fucosidase 2
MERTTRRRFLASASTVAGSLLLADRFSIAEVPHTTPDGLKLWYTEPAKQWVDALPIGNGRLGAMVYGGGILAPRNYADPATDHERGPVPTDPARETLQLNEDTLWSGLPVDGNNPDAKNHLAEVRRAVLVEKDYHKADGICRQMQGLFAESYQPVGYLHIDFTHAGEVTDYRRGLDLKTAVSTTHYSVDGVDFERTAFVSAPDQAIVVRLKASKAGALTAVIWMDGALVRTKN